MARARSDAATYESADLVVYGKVEEATLERIPLGAPGHEMVRPWHVRIRVLMTLKGEPAPGVIMTRVGQLERDLGGGPRGVFGKPKVFYFVIREEAYWLVGAR